MHVAEAMLSIGRRAAALDLVGLYLRSDGSDSVETAELVVKGLEALLIGEPDPEMPLLSEWDFRQLFGLLERHHGPRCASKESPTSSGLTSLLSAWSRTPPHCTSCCLKEHASFFVQVLTALFPPTPDNRDLDADERERIAHNGFRLLHSWSRLPGTRLDGSVDAAALKKWIADVQGLLIPTGRQDIGDVYIGQSLASAPSDEVGRWPCIEVRDLLEDLHNDAIEEGMRTALLNRRGPTSRSLDEGGAQERVIVERYEAEADGFADQWPRTAALLRDLANAYRAEGRRAEERAEALSPGPWVLDGPSAGTCSGSSTVGRPFVDGGRSRSHRGSASRLGPTRCRQSQRGVA